MFLSRMRRLIATCSGTRSPLSPPRTAVGAVLGAQAAEPWIFWGVFEESGSIFMRDYVSCRNETQSTQNPWWQPLYKIIQTVIAKLPKKTHSPARPPLSSGRLFLVETATGFRSGSFVEFATEAEAAGAAIAPQVWAKRTTHSTVDHIPKRTEENAPFVLYRQNFQVTTSGDQA